MLAAQVAADVVATADDVIRDRERANNKRIGARRGGCRACEASAVTLADPIPRERRRSCEREASALPSWAPGQSPTDAVAHAQVVDGG